MKNDVIIFEDAIGQELYPKDAAFYIGKNSPTLKYMEEVIVESLSTHQPHVLVSYDAKLENRMHIVVHVQNLLKISDLPEFTMAMLLLSGY